ncbi:BspA family leucine-rich repeat surface protein, partial [Planktomarina temperata]|uniref:BspA family leucine-rich repeat surface protein n=1 Tax=Planktomarina temperata TaxID=1284658 RepID=UPI003F69F502
SQSPRREFFYAAEVATLEEIAFPKNSLASINFQRNTLNYNVTIFDEKGIEIRVRVTEFDNVGHPNATVSIGGSGPLVLDAQGYATHTVPVTMTRLSPNQTVRINVTSPDGSNVVTYTLNLSAQVIDDTNVSSFVASCLAEDPVGGICPIWASGAGVPTMPNWDVSDVTYMAGLFQSLPNFNGDITKWDTSNVVNFAAMFRDSTSFNQDLREWSVKWNADLRTMFLRATALHATFAGTAYFADTPRESFFYAFDTDTLENVSFPNDPSIVISFNRRTRSYNLTVPDKNSIDIALGVSDFSNVNGQTATVTVDTNPVALDSQGKALYTLPITATFGTPQVVTIDVTASDGVTVGTYTFNLTVDFLTNANIVAAVNACLAEAPATGNCPVYAATSGRPVMSNWNVTHVTDMGGLFQNHTNFDGNISSWNVSNVTNMQSMFRDAAAFNQDISPWNVGSVTDMSAMFFGASSFDQALSVWNVGNVTNMSQMFELAGAFNSSLKDWNVSNVTNMSKMFAGSRLFDQDIGGWTVTNVSDMSSMFDDARAFNQNIGPWRPQNLTTMASMFESAHSFNQDISQWDVSTVRSMSGLFYDARSFNQDISPWDVSNVTTMDNMFGYSPFNQNIGGWDVGNVTTIGGMFQSNILFNQDISRWNTSNMTSMGSAFENARGFTQDISNWDTSKVTSFDYMFKDVQFMNADLRPWEVGPTATLTNMFDNALSQQGQFNTHPFFGNTPRREFFYARDVATLEDLYFPNEPNVVIAFNPSTTTYNVVVPDKTTLDIGAWVTEYDNVRRPNATVKIDGTPVTFNAQGQLTHTVPLAMSPSSPNQVVLVEVTSPDTGTTQTYTLNLTAAIITDTNLAAHVAGCLSEAPVTGLCPVYAGSQLIPTMPLWKTSYVTDLSNVFQGRGTFNADISAWDTARVTTLASAFASASAFNQDISSWDTKNVTDMSSAFEQSIAFDQDIGGWDVSAVTSFVNMLDSAATFDQEIRGWNLNPAVTATDLTSMFSSATAMHATYAGVGGFANSPTLAFFNQSPDATLASLSVNGALSPITLTPGVQTYSVTLPYQANATLNLTVNEFNHTNLSYASAAVNGTSVTLNTTGSGTVSVPLTATPNTAQPVSILVTAPDGSTLTYTVNITRQSNDASLSNLISSVGSLSPVFAPGTTAYSVTVPHSTTTVTLTPTVNEPNATVVINSGNPITLSVGANPIAVTVTSQDGSTTLTYTVTVTRAPSSDATLSNLTSSIGTLTPSFAPAVTAYSFTVANAVTTLTLTPTVNDPNATVMVNNGNPIALAVGANPILVEVTAQDGTTKITYTVTVTRDPSSDATLSNLTSSIGTLT